MTFIVGYRGSLIPNFGTFIFSKNLVQNKTGLYVCVLYTPYRGFDSIVDIFRSVSLGVHNNGTIHTSGGLIPISLFMAEGRH